MTDPDPPGEPPPAPFVSVRHRRHAARQAAAFGLGFVCGAAAVWIVVLAVTYARP